MDGARSLVALILFLAASPLWAQPGTSNLTREELQAKVLKLEDRIGQLERSMAAFIRSQGGAGMEESVEPRPAPPPPPPEMVAAKQRFEMPPELVPEVGKIGAQIGLLLSGATSPFKLNSGTFAGGFIDLPLFDRPQWLHGKVSYEILVGMSQSQTTFTTTSNVAQVANLAVLTALNPNGGLANVAAAVTGTGSAPFPVTQSTETRLRLLQVVPFALKYQTTALDRYRLRPYLVGGFGTFVTIHVQNPARGTPPSYGIRPDADITPEVLAVVQQLFGGQAPFGGPLVAGQISQAPELEARGLPGGHGNIDFGLHGAVGIEYRLNGMLSLGFDARFNRIAGTNGVYRTFGSRIGFHF
ncbi:MAG: hypothetical protein ABI823_01135 [Bryobacteraceae bacterium]